jgi:uncharacterized Tic20 family protein
MSEIQHEVPYDELPELTSEACNWAMACHLAGLAGFALPIVGHLLGPLIVWMIKRDDHPFINDQGKEAVNFQISMVIYKVLLCCTVIGIVVAIGLLLVNVVMVIVAAMKASEGEAYRYPLTLRLIK